MEVSRTVRELGLAAGCTTLLLGLACALVLTGFGEVHAAQVEAVSTGSSGRSAANIDAPAEAELQQGISLTSQGQFTGAIPHLKAALGKVHEAYAAGFNLALCYVATGQDEPAIQLLTGLRESGYDTANLHDLLAQAYAGGGKDQEALKSLARAAELDPANEKLYLYVEDAASGRQNYELALKILDIALQKKPASARLHYERGALLSMLDEFDTGRKDFDAARRLAAGSTIAYLAAAQTSLYEGKIDDAVRLAREGVASGNDDYMLLAILGEALLRSGVAPGDTGLREAEAALEKSVAQKPNYSSSQLSLGKVYLMEGRLDDAISHLEICRSLKPDDAAAYATLATAYRRKGQAQRAGEMLAILARLNQQQAARISAAGGNHRAAYGQSRARQSGSASPP